MRKRFNETFAETIERICDADYRSSAAFLSNYFTIGELQSHFLSLDIEPFEPIMQDFIQRTEPP